MVSRVLTYPGKVHINRFNKVCNYMMIMVITDVYLAVLDGVSGVRAF